MKPKLIVWANKTSNLNPIIEEITREVKLSVKEITITKIETNPDQTTLNLISEEIKDGKQVRYVVSVDSIGDFSDVKVGDKIKIGFKEEVVNVPAAGLKRTITYYEVLELVTDAPPTPPPKPPCPCDDKIIRKIRRLEEIREEIDNKMDDLRRERVYLSMERKGISPVNIPGYIDPWEYDGTSYDDYDDRDEVPFGPEPIIETPFIFF